MSISRRQLLQTSACAGFGALLLPKMAEAQGMRDSILQFDLQGGAPGPYKIGRHDST